MNMILFLLFSTSFLVDLVFGDLDIDNILRFTIPFAIGFVIYLPLFFYEQPPGKMTRKERYTAAVASFIYLVGMGSLPFFISGEMGITSSIFESMAGFTTTGLSSYDPEVLISSGHGLMFFRVAIQWAGGLFYLVFAFMFLSDVADIAKRSVDRKIFSRIGLVPNLSSLLQNLTLIYGLFTISSLLAFYLGGMDLFDSICLSLSTVSTGGFTSTGRSIGEGSGIHMIVVLFMFLTATGYYVHMSVFSARGRKRTLMDTENISYLFVTLTFPVVIFLILLFGGDPASTSLWQGIFTVISAISTTGFMVDGMNDWPDSARFLLLILMLMGGSSLSLASGFKLQRVFLLIKGFFGEVRRASHPNAVIPLRRGEGSYSEKALESANMTFFYLFGLLALAIGVVLIFKGDMFDVFSLCITSIANSGMAFGEFGTPEGVGSLNWFLKIVLSLIMLLGRFEILLPLYFISLRSHRFGG